MSRSGISKPEELMAFALFCTRKHNPASIANTVKNAVPGSTICRATVDRHAKKHQWARLRDAVDKINGTVNPVTTDKDITDSPLYKEYETTLQRLPREKQIIFKPIIYLIVQISRDLQNNTKFKTMDSALNKFIKLTELLNSAVDKELDIDAKLYLIYQTIEEAIASDADFLQMWIQKRPAIRESFQKKRHLLENRPLQLNG